MVYGKDVYVSMSVNMFPYFIFDREIKNGYGNFINEIREICGYYIDYENGVQFNAEGSHGDYVPSSIRYKIAKSLIDKEARFMFSRFPDINIKSDDTSEESKKKIDSYKKVISSIIKSNSVASGILKAARDCFIGKRVACLVDFSEEVGVGIHFYDSRHFYCEREIGTKIMNKFVCYEEPDDFCYDNNKMYIVTRYTREKREVYMSMIVYDKSGKEIEKIIPETLTSLKEIPVVIIFNEGLLSEKQGISDMRDLVEFEQGYNMLGNADIDSERKGMNPTVVLVDMNHRTTKNLSSGAGAVWDLESSQVVQNKSPQVKNISPDLVHSEAVNTTMTRLRTTMYNVFDMPDISVEGALSGVTSYKAVRALYFPLTVRCDEKMIAWKESLEKIVMLCFDLCKLNEDVAKEVYNVEGLGDVLFNVEIVENYALLEDENEEKTIDLDEVNSNVRSRHSYLEKWRNEELRTEKDIEEEILRIATEQNMLDTFSMNTNVRKEFEKQEEDEEVQNEMEEIEAQENVNI